MTNITLRSWLKMTAGGAGVTLAGLGIELKDACANAEQRKLEGVQEYTTACNFCSCGCGMVAHVRGGKLVNLEGDPDHIINEGALCS